MLVARLDILLVEKRVVRLRIVVRKAQKDRGPEGWISGRFESMQTSGHMRRKASLDPEFGSLHASLYSTSSLGLDVTSTSVLWLIHIFPSVWYVVVPVPQVQSLQLI